jgi:hypothetical protein
MKPKRTDGRKTTQQAPKLASGEVRVKDYGRLPEDIKEGLRAIAKDERKSMSWVKEQVIIEFFKLKRPRYKGVESKAKVLPMRRHG